MKVLHDWDDPYLNWKWSAYLGYWYTSHLFVARDTLLKHAETLAKLDKLCGVESIFGLRSSVKRDHPQILDILSDHGVDVREHKHVGESYTDPDRQRTWNPPLNQPPHTWRYDKHWVQGKTTLLNKDELPIWHVDRPYYLPDYIDFLYQVKVKGAQIYG